MAYKKELGGETDQTVELTKVGDRLEGVYLGCKEVTSKMYYNKDGTPKTSKFHMFKMDDGSTTGTWGKSYLNGLLKSKHVGYQCLVEMTGMIPPKMRGEKPAYGYDLHVDWDKKVSIDGIEVHEDTSFNPDEIESGFHSKTSNNKR